MAPSSMANASATTSHNRNAGIANNATRPGLICKSRSTAMITTMLCPSTSRLRSTTRPPYSVNGMRTARIIDSDEVKQMQLSLTSRLRKFHSTIESARNGR